MSDERGDVGKEDSAERDEGLDPVAEVELPAMTALLKRSLATPEETADDAKDRALLLGVQRKLRKRSRGKFYADGWSTSQSRVNYALVAAIMLVVIVAVYLALGPMGISLH